MRRWLEYSSSVMLVGVTPSLLLNDGQSITNDEKTRGKERESTRHHLICRSCINSCAKSGEGIIIYFLVVSRVS